MSYRKSASSIRVGLSISIVTLVLAALLLGMVPAVRADEPVVRAVLFWAESCPHCHEVMDHVIPPLEEKYGDQLEVRTIEISDPDNYPLWVAAMEAFQVPPGSQGVPMLFIGDAVLVGSREIPEQLPGLIEQHLAAGGVDYPDVPGLKDAPEPVLEATAGPPRSVVQMYFFYDRLCGECVLVEEEVLAPLKERLGEQLLVKRVDVETSTDNYNLLRGLERQYGLERGAMPVVFIGQEALAGETAVRERLPGLVEEYLAAGGTTLPELTATPTPVPTPAVDPEPETEPSQIHLAYFYQPGCPECDRVQLALNYLKDQYPQLNVCTLDVREQATLCEWLGEQTGVPVGKRLTAPAVFVGDDALVGDDLHPSSLEALLARYAESGTRPICTGDVSDEVVSTIVERFRSFGLATVLVAGLVDGLNPCAFATLVFFISYLAFMGRKGREVLIAGGAFALGVFLTYLGVGFGVLKFLATLPFLDVASRWIYGITAVLCFLLAIGSLYDWLKARRGKTSEMRLKMPTRLRRWVNRAIREGSGTRFLAPVTFVTGVVVSIIELACTGQVYLPTILFVLGVPEMEARATFYLVLYNLMFVLPLVVVFALVYFGTTSEQLGLLIHRHTAKVKLATAGLFFLLAGWMVVTLI